MKSKIKLLTILTTLLTYLSNPHRNMFECTSETSRTKFRKVRHKTTKGERRFMIAPVRSRIAKLDLDDGKEDVAKKLNLVACHGSKCRTININSPRLFPTVTMNRSSVKKELGTNFPKWIMLLYNTDAQNFAEIRNTENKSSGPTAGMMETHNRVSVANTSSRNPRENITLVIQSLQNTKAVNKHNSRKSIKRQHSFLESKENVSSNLHLNSSIASKGGKNITKFNEEKLNQTGNKTEKSNSTKAIEKESGYIPKIDLNNKKFEKQIEHCIHKTNRHQKHKKQATERKPLQDNERNQTDSNLNITHRKQNSARFSKIRLNSTNILLANKTDDKRKNTKNDVTGVNNTEDDREYIIPFIQKETNINNDRINDSKQTDNATTASEDLLKTNFENQNYFDAILNQQILKEETDATRENRQLSNNTIEGLTPSDSVFTETGSLFPQTNSTESIKTDLHFPESVLTNNAEGEVSDIINENVVNIIKNLMEGEDYISEENTADTDSSRQNHDFLNKNPSPEDSTQEDKTAPDFAITPEQSISIKSSSNESQTTELLHKNPSPEERVAQGQDPTAGEFGSEENVLINPSGGAMAAKTNSINTDPEEVLTNEQLMNTPEIENGPDGQNTNESDVHLPEMVLTNVKIPSKPLRINQKSGHQWPQNLNRINGTSDQETEKESFKPENVLTNFPVNKLKSDSDITTPTMEEETHTPTNFSVGKITNRSDRVSSIDETISKVQNIHGNEDFQNSNENKVQFAETVLTNSPDGVVIEPTKKKEQVLVNDSKNESNLHVNNESSNKEALPINGNINKEAAKLEEKLSTAQTIYPAYDVLLNETKHKDFHNETAQASQTNGEAAQTKENADAEDDSQATFYHEEPEIALDQAGRTTNKNQEVTPNALDAFAKSEEMSLTAEKSQNQNNTLDHHFQLATGTSLLEQQQLQQQHEKHRQTLQEQNNIGYENHTAGNAMEIINKLSINTATNNDLNPPNSLPSHHMNNTENKLVPQEEEEVSEETEVVLPNSPFGKLMNNSAANNIEEGVNEEFEYHDQNEEMFDVLSKFREKFLYNFTQLEQSTGNNCSTDAINEQKLKNITMSNTLKVMHNPENVLTNPTVKPLSFLESLPTHHQNPTETMKRKKVLLDVNIFKTRRNRTIKNDEMEAIKSFTKKGNKKQNGEHELNKDYLISNEVWLKNHSNLGLAHALNETSKIKIAVNSTQKPWKTYNNYEINNNLKHTEPNTKYNKLKLIGQKKYIGNTSLSLDDNKDSEHKSPGHKYRYDFSELVKRITQVLSKSKNKTVSKIRPDNRESEVNQYTDLMKKTQKKDSELVNKTFTKNFSKQNPIWHEKLKYKLMRLFYKQMLKKISEDVERAIMLEKDKENNMSRELNPYKVVTSEKLENKTAVKRNFELKYKYNKRTPLMVSYNIPHRYKNVN